MRNWKIGTRIGTGFAAVIAISVVLGLFAYSRVGTVGQASTRITRESLPGVYLVGQLQKNTLKMFTFLLQHVSSSSQDSSSQEEMASLETEIQRLRAENDIVLREYEKLLSDEKEKALYEAVRAAREAQRSRFNEILQLSRELKNREAIALLNKEFKPLQRRYQEAGDTLAAYNKSAADTQSKSIEETVSGARTGVLMGLGLALAAALAVSFAVVRGITRPLAVAVGLVDRVAQGDLSQKVASPSTDELGHMLAAMNLMVENLNGAVQVAVRISEGDLSVQPKALSEKDVLGHALVRMVENLNGAVHVAVAISEGDLTICLLYTSRCV